MDIDEFYIVLRKDMAYFFERYKEGMKEGDERFPEYLTEDEWYDQFFFCSRG